MRPSRNPWDLLGITQGASLDEVKRAYKKKAMECHPDRNGDPELFKMISDAYMQLKNRTHVPILSQPEHKLVHIKLSIKEQILGVNGIVSTSDGTLLELKLPAGLNPNEKFKVKSQGKNYIINIIEEKHKIFTRQGNNVIMYLNVDLIYALKGGIYKFIGPCDEDLQLDIPAGTKPNSLFVINYKGLYNRKTKKTGHLHIFLDYNFPILDTDESIEDFIIRLKR